MIPALGAITSMIIEEDSKFKVHKKWMSKSDLV